MKKIFLLLLVLYAYSIGFAQSNNTIVITKIPKTVPSGRKWVLEAGKQTRVQVSYGVLNSGSLCNALFLSLPGIVANVNRGDVFNAEGYMLIFKEPDKVPYTNEFTYDLTILSIVDKNFSVSELQIKQPEDVGMKKIEFKAGESVFVGNCLESIELKDVTMTQAELETIKMKEIEINKANTQKLINFNIPINPEKAVEPGTIPVIHDKKLKSITFSSTSVLFKLPGKRYSLDNISTWTLELNVDEFSLHSSNGIDKTYKVIKIGYDEEMRMQKFTLGDENNVETHTLLIAWSTNSNQYSLLLNSIDNSEDFQFQDVQTTTKQFQ